MVALPPGDGAVVVRVAGGSTGVTVGTVAVAVGGAPGGVKPPAQLTGRRIGTLSGPWSVATSRRRLTSTPHGTPEATRPVNAFDPSVVPPVPASPNVAVLSIVAPPAGASSVPRRFVAVAGPVLRRRTESVNGSPGSMAPSPSPGASDPVTPSRTSCGEAASGTLIISSPFVPAPEGLRVQIGK